MKKPKDRKPANLPQPTAEGIARAEQKREALVLRKSGLDYDSIADKLGIPKNKVAILVREAIQDIPAEEAADMRAIEGQRLDDMHERTIKAIKVYEREVAQFEKSNGLKGRCPSNQVFIELQDHLLSIANRRAKMFGIDAPTEVKGSGVALLGLADLLQVQDAMSRNVDVEEPCPPLLPKN
jgi:hypothetical protein